MKTKGPTARIARCKACCSVRRENSCRVNNGPLSDGCCENAFGPVCSGCHEIRFRSKATPSREPRKSYAPLQKLKNKRSFASQYLCRCDDLCARRTSQPSCVTLVNRRLSHHKPTCKISLLHVMMSQSDLRHVLCFFFFFLSRQHNFSPNRD